MMPVLAALRPQKTATPISDRHIQSVPSPARPSRPAPKIINDVTALAGDPEMLALVRRDGRRRRADAHAGHAADDAGRSDLRRRGRRRAAYLA